MIILTTLLALGPTARAATTTSQVKGSYTTLSATFTDGACLSGSIYLWSATTVTHTKGSAPSSTGVDDGAWVSWYDSCTYTFDGGYTDNIGAGLGASGYSGTLTVTSYYTGDTVSVPLSVSASGAKTTSRGNDHQRYQYPAGSTTWKVNSVYSYSGATGTVDGWAIVDGYFYTGTANSGTLTTESY